MIKGKEGEEIIVINSGRLFNCKSVPIKYSFTPI